MSDRHHTLIPSRPWHAIDDVVYDASHNEVLRCPDQHIARAVVEAMETAEHAAGWKHDAISAEADREHVENELSRAENETRELRTKVAALEEKLGDIRALAEGDAA